MGNRFVNICLVLFTSFWIGSWAGADVAWLKPVVVRSLSLERPLIKGLPGFLAAGSGLVALGDCFVVIADDAQSLAVFAGEAPGQLHPLLERSPLPLDPRARKQAKPDFEALVQAGDEGLLVLGSGSRVNRRTGVWVALPEFEPREFSLMPLYKALDKRYPTVNIEGVAALPDRLRLAQRGNAKGGSNAIIDLDRERAVERACRGSSWDPELILAERVVELGTLPGSRGPVPFTLTDLTALPDGSCLFTAAAEDTLNPVDDGRVLGTGLGKLDAEGRVTGFWRLDTPYKCEGLAVRDGTVWLVTDADDPWQPAQLLRVTLP